MSVCFSNFLSKARKSFDMLENSNSQRNIWINYLKIFFLYFNILSQFLIQYSWFLKNNFYPQLILPKSLKVKKKKPETEKAERKYMHDRTTSATYPLTILFCLSKKIWINANVRGKGVLHLHKVRISEGKKSEVDGDWRRENILIQVQWRTVLFLFP